MRLTTGMRALFRRIAREQASSRPVALVRIAVPLMLWSRFGSQLAFFTHPFSVARVALSVAFFITTTAMLVGLWSRASSFLVGATMIAVAAVRGGMGGERAFLHHHVALLIITALALSLTPCDRSFSVDRMRALAKSRGGEPPPERGLVYGQWLLRVQIAVLYVGTAIDKTNMPFLSGVRLQHFLHEYYLGSHALEGQLVPTLACVAAVMTVLLEYALGLFLFHPRAQRVLLPMGLAFHAVLYLFLPVHTFSLTMAALYLLVPDPDRVHAEIDSLVR